MTSPVLITLLEDWVREAVMRHGDDWPAIMAAVEKNLQGLGEKQRAELTEQIRSILASPHFCAHPDPN